MATKKQQANSLYISRGRQYGAMRLEVAKWIRFMGKQIMEDINRIFKQAQGNVVFIQWEIIEGKGDELLFPPMLKTYLSGKNAANRHLGIAGSFDIFNEQAATAARTLTSQLVTEATAVTKASVAEQIGIGIEQGLSTAQVAERIQPLVGLTSNQAASVRNLANRLAEEGTLSPTQQAKAVRLQSKKMHILRTNTIARTELARAQSIGYADRMEALEQTHLEFVPGPTTDDYCLDFAGIHPIDEARTLVPVHPMCTCILLPVI